MKSFIAGCITFLILFLHAFAAGAQQKKITGRVFDDQAKPLAGASVALKDTKASAVCDADGRFTLNAPPEGKILVVSYVGMLKKEIPLNGQTSYTINLQPSPGNLANIVVVGYGTVKKSDVAIEYLKQRGVTGETAKRFGIGFAPDRWDTIGSQVPEKHALEAGLSNSRIGDRLHISAKTVDHHVSAILTKLDVPTRQDAARLSRQWQAGGQHGEALGPK